MTEEKKCDDHSGMCSDIGHCIQDTKDLWDAIKDIRNKLWYILFIVSAGALGTLANLVISNSK